MVPRYWCASRIGNVSTGIPKLIPAQGHPSPAVERKEPKTSQANTQAGIRDSPDHCPCGAHDDDARDKCRERARAGPGHARQNGQRLGRPETAALHAAEIGKLHLAGINKSEITRRLQIVRTSVRRILRARS